MDKDKFIQAQKDIISLITLNKLSATKRGEFTSVADVIENIFENADDEFLIRIEEYYWCNNLNCPHVKDNNDNGIKKDIVHNYQFGHILTSKTPQRNNEKSLRLLLHWQSKVSHL